MNPEPNEAAMKLSDQVNHLFATEHDPQSRRLAAADPLYQAKSLWKRLAALGALGANVPDSLGGSAASAHDAAIATHRVMQAMGRHLALEPFVTSAVMSTSLLADAGDEAQKAFLLPGMIDGRIRLALAAFETEEPCGVAHVTTRAARQPLAWVLDGAKSGIVDARHAHWMVVSARTAGNMDEENGISLFLVAPTARGVEMEYRRGPDGTEIANATLRGVEVATNDLIGAMDQGFAPLQRAVQRGMAALCSEAAGAMEQLLATCDNGAEARSLVEEARSAALLAAAATCNPDSAERDRAITNARTMASRAARKMAQEAEQRPGGAGIAAGLTVTDYVRRLNVIAANWEEV
jgi:alkylation response protein AidB-like acyl-CoA dehydrogenase